MKFTKSLGWGSSLLWWRIFYYLHTMAKWFNKSQLLQVLSLLMLLSQCPGSHCAPHWELCNGVGQMSCLWKLFVREQFEERVLGGYCFALTLARRRVLLWVWICFWFCIPISVLIASSGVFLGSTVSFKNSFWFSW